MPKFGTEQVPLAAACGRVLRQTVVAERDQPPFDRVTMDGIALRYADIAGGARQLRIQSRQHAGDAPQSLHGGAHCIEIMTGAVLPPASDTVIPVERIQVANGHATLEDGYVPTQGQFVHARGSDYRRNHVVLEDRHRIQATDVAVVASSGLSSVAVSRDPSIRVISTGNELVAAGLPIADHQIRLSNGPALVAMLQTHGYRNSEDAHIDDDPDSLRQHLDRHLREADVLVLSGGVSMGKADFVPQVLADLGVEVVFHKISQRPGKPMWFGIGPDEQAVFALPGNPVSALVCARQYVVPALAEASARIAIPAEHAMLASDFEFAPALTCFLPVKLAVATSGTIQATPVITNTSGDFTALSRTDGYLQLPLDQQHFSAGSSWPLHRWMPTH